MHLPDINISKTSFYTEKYPGVISTSGQDGIIWNEVTLLPETTFLNAQNIFEKKTMIPER